MISLRGGGPTESKQAVKGEADMAQAITSKDYEKGFLTKIQKNCQNIAKWSKLTIDNKDNLLNAFQFFQQSDLELERLCISNLSSSCLDIFEECCDCLLESMQYFLKQDANFLLCVIEIFAKIVKVVYKIYITSKQFKGVQEKLEAAKTKVAEFEKNLKKAFQEHHLYPILAFEIWKISSLYEIIPVDSKDAEEILKQGASGLLKAATSFSLNDDLMDSIKKGAVMLYKEHKKRQIKRIHGILNFIERVKYYAVDIIQEGQGLTDIKKYIQNGYKMVSEESNDWQILFCWIRMNFYIVNYRIQLKPEQIEGDIDQYVKEKRLMQISEGKFEINQTHPDCKQFVQQLLKKNPKLNDFKNLQVFLLAGQGDYKGLEAIFTKLYKIKIKKQKKNSEKEQSLSYYMDMVKALVSLLEKAQKEQKTLQTTTNKIKQNPKDLQGIDKQLQSYEQLLDQILKAQFLFKDLCIQLNTDDLTFQTLDISKLSQPFKDFLISNFYNLVIYFEHMDFNIILRLLKSSSSMIFLIQYLDLIAQIFNTQENILTLIDGNQFKDLESLCQNYKQNSNRSQIDFLNQQELLLLAELNQINVKIFNICKFYATTNLILIQVKQLNQGLQDKIDPILLSGLQKLSIEILFINEAAILLYNQLQYYERQKISITLRQKNGFNNINGFLQAELHFRNQEVINYLIFMRNYNKNDCGEVLSSQINTLLLKNLKDELNILQKSLQNFRSAFDRIKETFNIDPNQAQTQDNEFQSLLKEMQTFYDNNDLVSQIKDGNQSTLSQIQDLINSFNEFEKSCSEDQKEKIQKLVYFNELIHEYKINNAIDEELIKNVIQDIMAITQDYYQEEKQGQIQKEKTQEEIKVQLFSDIQNELSRLIGQVDIKVELAQECIDSLVQTKQININYQQIKKTAENLDKVNKKKDIKMDYYQKIQKEISDALQQQKHQYEEKVQKISIIKFEKLQSIVNETQKINYQEDQNLQIRFIIGSISTVKYREELLSTLESLAVDLIDESAWFANWTFVHQLLLAQRQQIFRQPQECIDSFIVKVKAMEDNVHVKKLFTQTEFVDQIKSLLSTQFQDSNQQIQNEIQDSIQQVNKLLQQIESEKNPQKRQNLQNQYQQLQKKVQGRIANVSDIGSSLQVNVQYLQEMQGQLGKMDAKLDKLQSGIDDMKNDLEYLKGKSFKELLDIRMQSVLKQMEKESRNEIYVQIITREKNIQTQKEFNETPLFSEEIFGDGEINEFVWQDSKDSLLIHGPAGSGKTLASYKIEQFIWKYQQQHMNEPGYIPLVPIIVPLPQLKDPRYSAIEETLKSDIYYFDDKKIQDLKQAIYDGKLRLLIILESYDEMNPSFHKINLIHSNKIGSKWRAEKDVNKYPKIITTCRSEIFDSSQYHEWFIGETSKLQYYKEIRLISFNKNQILEYIRQFCNISLISQIQEILQYKLNMSDTDITNLSDNMSQIQILGTPEQEQLMNKDQIHQFFVILKSFAPDITTKIEKSIEFKLQDIWSHYKYLKIIEELNLDHLIQTPFMLQIVINVIPKIYEQRKRIESKRNFLERFQQFFENKDLKEAGQIWQTFSENKQFCDVLDNNKQLDQGSIYILLLRYFPQIQDKIQLSKALQVPKLTTYDFYDEFLHQFFSKQLQRMLMSGRQFDIDQMTIDLWYFCKGLAEDMSSRHITQVEYKQQGRLEEQKVVDWRDKYFNDRKNGEYKKLVRICLPIIQRNSSYQFIHKSIQEFLTAKQIIENLIRDSNAEDLLEHPMGKLNLSSNFMKGTAGFLRDCISQNKQIKEKLLGFMRLSINNIKFIQISSNALFLLTQINHKFISEDFTGLRISNINLGGINLINCQLNQTEIENCNISDATLCESKIKESKWVDLYTNEVKVHQLSGPISELHFIKTLKKFLILSQDDDLYLYNPEAPEEEQEYYIENDVDSLNILQDEKYIWCEKSAKKKKSQEEAKKTIKVFNLQNFDEVIEPYEIDDDIKMVSLAKDNQFLLYIKQNVLHLQKQGQQVKKIRINQKKKDADKLDNKQDQQDKQQQEKGKDQDNEQKQNKGKQKDKMKKPVKTENNILDENAQTLVHWDQQTFIGFKKRILIITNLEDDTKQSRKVIQISENIRFMKYFSEKDLFAIATQSEVKLLYLDNLDTEIIIKEHDVNQMKIQNNDLLTCGKHQNEQKFKLSAWDIKNQYRKNQAILIGFYASFVFDTTNDETIIATCDPDDDRIKMRDYLLINDDSEASYPLDLILIPNDPNYLISIDVGNIFIWETQNFTQIGKKMIHQAYYNQILCLQFKSENQTILYSGGRNHKIYAWDLVFQTNIMIIDIWNIIPQQIYYVDNDLIRLHDEEKLMYLIALNQNKVTKIDLFFRTQQTNFQIEHYENQFLTDCQGLDCTEIYQDFYEEEDDDEDEDDDDDDSEDDEDDEEDEAEDQEEGQDKEEVNDDQQDEINDTVNNQNEKNDDDVQSLEQNKKESRKQSKSESQKQIISSNSDKKNKDNDGNNQKNSDEKTEKQSTKQSEVQEDGGDKKKKQTQEKADKHHQLKNKDDNKEDDDNAQITNENNGDEENDGNEDDGQENLEENQSGSGNDDGEGNDENENQEQDQEHDSEQEDYKGKDQNKNDEINEKDDNKEDDDDNKDVDGKENSDDKEDDNDKDKDDDKGDDKQDEKDQDAKDSDDEKDKDQNKKESQKGKKQNKTNNDEVQKAESKIRKFAKKEELLVGKEIIKQSKKVKDTMDQFKENLQTEIDEENQNSDEPEKGEQQKGEGKGKEKSSNKHAKKQKDDENQNVNENEKIKEEKGGDENKDQPDDKSSDRKNSENNEKQQDNKDEKQKDSKAKDVKSDDSDDKKDKYSNKSNDNEVGDQQGQQNEQISQGAEDINQEEEVDNQNDDNQSEGDEEIDYDEQVQEELQDLDYINAFNYTIITSNGILSKSYGIEYKYESSFTKQKRLNGQISVLKDQIDNKDILRVVLEESEYEISIKNLEEYTCDFNELFVVCWNSEQILVYKYLDNVDKPMNQIKIDDSVKCIIFNSLYLYIMRDKQIEIWQMKLTHKPIFQQQFNYEIYRGYLLNKSERILIWTEEGQLKFLNQKDLKPLKESQIYEDLIICIPSLNEDIIVLGYSSYIQVITLEDQQLICQINQDYNYFTYSSEEQVLCVGLDNNIKKYYLNLQIYKVLMFQQQNEEYKNEFQIKKVLEKRNFIVCLTKSQIQVYNKTGEQFLQEKSALNDIQNSNSENEFYAIKDSSIFMIKIIDKVYQKQMKIEFNMKVDNINIFNEFILLRGLLNSNPKEKATDEEQKNMELFLLGINQTQEQMIKLPINYSQQIEFYDIQQRIIYLGQSNRRIVLKQMDSDKFQIFTIFQMKNELKADNCYICQGSNLRKKDKSNLAELLVSKGAILEKSENK